MVQTALRSKLGGDRIIQEYNKMKCLSDASRRKMVNILVADMMENHGSVTDEVIFPLVDSMAVAAAFVDVFVVLRLPLLFVLALAVLTLFST